MLVPWDVVTPLLRAVTVVDSLVAVVISAGFVCNPRTAAVETEERTTDKYKELVDDGYLFQTPVFEIQRAAGPNMDFFERAS